MKASLNWLKDYLKLDNVSNEELFKIFSYHISELEDASYLCKIDNLSIGHVLECEEVEGTHLHKCQIEIRPGEVSQIVCGAPNMKKGARLSLPFLDVYYQEISRLNQAKFMALNLMVCAVLYKN